MKKEISIIGGNIAGLSAAWHLARRGFKVTVYEARIWNKPCGGAVSCEFARYLDHTIGIVAEGADHFVPGVRLVFRHNRYFDIKGFFVVTRRLDLQQKLIERLDAEPGIDIVFKRVSISDRSLFTPQTVVAAGYSGFTRRILQDNWNRLSNGIIFRFDGHAEKGPHPNRHLMIFDSRINGYGWVFLGKGNHVNIGIGGLADRTLVRQWYSNFLDYIKQYHGYHIRPENPEPAGWKIPVLRKNWKHPVSFLSGGVEFIGTGDVLGLAHPFAGAGIEPAWQSGWLLALCANPQTGVIDTEKYARLLERNLRLTCRKPVDLALAAMAKNRLLPYKDALGRLAVRLATPYMLRMIKKYPWFAPVHDGHNKTGYKPD